jgi:DNA polymerase I-like protein with 3'-5' exonuclease and polymerase domains
VLFQPEVSTNLYQSKDQARVRSANEIEATEDYYGYPVTKKMEERQEFKGVCHGTNYRGQAPTLAAQAGLSVPAVYRIIKEYFRKCPEIEQQLLNDESEVQRVGYLTTVFGARLWIPDFKDPMWVNKNAAASPQSSVGTHINKGLCLLEETENPSKFKRFAIWTPEGSFKEWGYNFDANVKERYNSIKTIMQVHDSAPCIFRKDDITAPRRLIEYYSQPIEIGGRIMRLPVDIKVSDKSYGDCNSELAKELLAKADKYIEEHPNWRNEL